MYHGILFYKQKDYQVNSWFAQHIIEVGKAYGLSIEVIFYEQWHLYKELPCDFIINRSREVEVSAYYEALGIHTFNSSHVVKIGNDKYAMFQALQDVVPVIPSLFNQPWPTVPYVMKSIDGHGGSEVYLVHEEPAPFLPSYISQPYLKDTRGDLRVLVMQDEIKIAILRKNNDDFRHNKAQGGKVRVYECSEEIKAYVDIIQRQLHMDFGGIDFLLLADGRIVVNEIEDVVGIRAVYECSDLDLVEDWMKMIKRRCEGSNE